MPITTVDVLMLKQWLDNHEVLLIDVREPAEYEAEHIPGALLLPLATLTRHQVPLNPMRKLVIHCRSGARSLSACNQLVKDDSLLEVFNLEGGILAWRKQGYPVGSVHD